jgi:type II secretory pathway pseudopilin PulG
MLKNGFTLVETLFGIALAGVTLLVAFVLMHQFYRGYIEIQEKLETEKALTMAFSILQRQLTLAVNVERSTTSLNSVSIAANAPGKILEYNGTSMAGVGGQIDTIALFVKENGGFQTPPSTSYAPVGIFYRRPTPTTSGVLFIDGSTLVSKTPSYSQPFFSSIVELTTSNFDFAPGGALTSMEFSITMRKFLESDTRRWVFCPQVDIDNNVGGCVVPGAVSFRDATRTMKVTFSNQILRTTTARNLNSNSPFERVFGSLYLFPYR